MAANREFKDQDSILSHRRAESQLSLSTVEQLSHDDIDPDGLSDDGEDRSRTVTSRCDQKRLAHEKLSEWISQHQEQVFTPAEVSTSFEQQSIRDMLRQGPETRIIDSPREYQVELFERSKRENILAVLDTGAGKTLVAIMLLKHTIDQELQDRSEGKPPRISFFLVNSVTLLLQQYAVLECNINQPIDRFCGEMGTDLWNKETWKVHFDSNLAIVCTAEVLYQCLHHSFIRMDQINLLIFDEAHHAKKNHAYARIIKDFYADAEDAANLPRIFGMTASPVDAKVNVFKAVSQLEGLLSCRVATASNAEMLKNVVAKKKEVIALYDPVEPAFETDLYKKIFAAASRHKLISRNLSYSLEATSQLGSWCADEVWKLVLSNNNSQGTRKNSILLQRLSPTKSQNAADREAEDAETLRAACEVVNNHIFRDPVKSKQFLSTKVLKLADLLLARFSECPEDKCIVFVKERHTAAILADLFAREYIGIPQLRVAALVGAGGGVGFSNVSFRDQTITMARFRKGEVNCLFATSVAEEGLDIPDCNLVIRFEPCLTLVQYIQSRGRARKADSIFVHLFERNNMGHKGLLAEVQAKEAELRTLCAKLPEDRLIKLPQYDLDFIRHMEKSQQSYTDPVSKAKLTYRVSMTVLANFVSSLPQDSEETHVIQTPIYIPSARYGLFVYEVCLPGTSPISGAVGKPFASKRLAKCSAAFEACILLRKAGYLDEHFLSKYTKQLPIMRNAHLALTLKGQKEYDIHTKPAAWSTGSFKDKAYLSVLVLNNPEALKNTFGHRGRPLGIITKAPLPENLQFPLYFDSQQKSYACIKGARQVKEISDDTLEHMNAFTLRIFHHVFSKQYASDIDKMSYLIVPLEKAATEEIIQKEALIDWKLLEYVSATEELPWQDQPETFFEDRYIIDPIDGSFKVFSKGLSTYKPTDLIPTFVPARENRRKEAHTIMQYSSGRRGKALETLNFKENQPVIEGEMLSLRRNFLDNRSTELAETKTVYIILEPLLVSPLPVDIVATAYCFPSIIYRIESCLIAMEACQSLGLAIRPELALEAFTKESENFEDHDNDQKRFERGLGNNSYERLEFLGDCFLKMATTIALFTQDTGSSEFMYHVDRMLMICNRNLLQNAHDKKLQEHIRSHGFNRRIWYPENLTLIKGKSATAPKLQKLGDKTIADVCEAVIGAALLTDLRNGSTDMAVKAVTVLVCKPKHTMQQFDDYWKLYTKPQYLNEQPSASELSLASKVEDVHPYHFTHPRLLQSAFTHGSYPMVYAKVPNYERLEFLGDALLDMACVNWLFHNFPGRDPQWLTEHKMAMVSNQFLAALCVELGFHKHLRHFSNQVQNQIQEYVQDLATAREAAKEGAVKAGKRSQDYQPDYWIDVAKPPKCLADIVEAYVGAIFVDSQYNFSEVERFFDSKIKQFFKQIEVYDTYANKHPLVLIRKALVDRLGCTNWNIAVQDIPSLGPGLPAQYVAAVMVHGEILSGFQDSSIRHAKARAADAALKEIQSLERSRFQMKYGCCCKGAVTIEDVATMKAVEILNDEGILKSRETDHND